jgi:hypothetical protein
MTTLRKPDLADFSADDQAILERVAKRMGQTPEGLLRPGIFGVQSHWPAWLESNFYALKGIRLASVSHNPDPRRSLRGLLLRRSHV